MTTGYAAIIDVGKTNAKLVLVDLANLSEVAVLTRPNTVLPGPPYPHFDTEGHWAFFLDGLAQFQASHGIAAITTTTHGASAALLDSDGGLAAPILDYEHDGPAETAAAYDAIRPPFSETGTPRLANGLNVGAQLHWQFSRDPTLVDRTACIVTHPQYWGYRLTGVAATDVTSIGCHTDLWNPHKGHFSSLVDTLGITDKIAAARRSASVLGQILPDIAARTGLAPDTPVFCGIHDSNASLLPHVMGNTPPFSVVSTGTWVVSMAVGGRSVALDPAKDVLINVNAYGDPVPSAPFMGGREHDLATGGSYPAIDDTALSRLLRDGVMLLPAVEPTAGPFKGRTAHWQGPAPAKGTAENGAAVSLYLAMVTETCLRNIGHAGQIIVEGPFAANPVFLSMLAVAAASPVVTSKGTTGTSQGAALLIRGALPPQQAQRPHPTPTGEIALAMRRYADRWRDLAGVTPKA